LESAPNHTQVVRTSTRNRSRITNGSELLRGVDGRSAEGRRYRDLTEAFGVEFGLGASEREMAAIRLAAALTVQSETLQAAIVRGERVAEEELTRALNAQAPALRERQPRRQAHQCLGGELRGLSAIDGRRKNTSISGVTLSDVCCIHSNSLRPSGSISGRHWRWLLCWL
jgi:hypothetical protein